MLPFLLLAGSAVTAIAGVKKGYDALKKNRKIKEIANYVKENDERTKREFLRAKDGVQLAADNAKIIMKEVYGVKLPQLYNLISSIKNIEGFIEKNELRSDINLNLGRVKTEIMELKDILTGVGTVLASGVATGVASNVLITKLIMSIGTASTGTALRVLSGVAARNAFLAFLGGGSLAAGGGGMALGSIVLGGITVAPAVLIGGFVMDEIMKGKLEDAKQELAKAEKVFEARREGVRFYNKLSSLIREYSNLMYNLSMIVDREIYRVNDIIRRYGYNAFDYDMVAMEEIRKAFKVLSIGAQLGKLEIIKSNGVINEDFGRKLQEHKLALGNLG